MLYDTICEIWPWYKMYPRADIEQKFVVKYRPDSDPRQYRPLVGLPREGVDPLRLLEES